MVSKDSNVVVVGLTIIPIDSSFSSLPAKITK